MKKKSPTFLSQIENNVPIMYAVNRIARGQFPRAEALKPTPWRRTILKEAGVSREVYYVGTDNNVELVEPVYQPALGKRHANRQLAARLEREKQARDLELSLRGVA